MVGSAVAAALAATGALCTLSPIPDGTVPEENEPDDARHLRHDQRVPPPRDRHRLARGADRAPHRAHQHAHGAPEGPQEGSSLPPRAAHARRSETSAARLPAAQRRREVPGAHRQARASPVTTFTRSGPAAPRFVFGGDDVGCQSPTSGFDPEGGNWEPAPPPLPCDERSSPMTGPISASAPIGESGKSLTFETGLLAPQADGAVVVSVGDTKVLVTAQASRGIREGIDFFPLTVDVEERMYAAGKIPG